MSVIQLSCERFKYCGSMSNEGKFKFTTADGEHLECSPIEAVFVSEKAHALIRTDSSAREVCIDCNKTVLPELHRLCKASPITVTRTNGLDLLKLAMELDNKELVDKIIEVTEVSMANVIPIMNMGVKSEKVASFYALHAHEIGDHMSLSPEQADLILSQNHMKLPGSESALFDQICNADNDEYLALIRHVDFRFLEKEQLQRYLELVHNAGLHSLVWSDVSKFIEQRIDFGPPSIMYDDRITRYNIYREFTYSSLDPLNGIINHLRSMCGGNPYSRRLVEICGDYISRNDFMGYGSWSFGGLFEYGSFTTHDLKFIDMIEFSFYKIGSVRLLGYTIKCRRGENALQSWELVARDRSSTVVDSRVVDMSDGEVRYFECSNPSQEFCSDFQLVSKGCEFQIEHIEFFGIVDPESRP